MSRQLRDAPDGDCAETPLPDGLGSRKLWASNYQQMGKDESMNTVVIEHVQLNELPAAWRAQLDATLNTRVTVRIEEEKSVPPQVTQTALVDNPLFGMWQDRADTADVAAYARELRAPRFDVDGSRLKG
jgi:hypothetical protein